MHFRYQITVISVFTLSNAHPIISISIISYLICAVLKSCIQIELNLMNYFILKKFEKL